ncbi:MAG: hypothetical protein XD44_0939, partial [Methanobacteriaceae archaeon 41_258]
MSSEGVMIAVGLSLTIYLISLVIVGEDRLNRFYERVTGEKPKKGGVGTPRAFSFGFMVVLLPFFLLSAGL